MHATIDVRFELSIDDDKTLPLATLAEAVTDQNLEAVLLESLVESSTPPALRRSVVKHAHGNGDQRFQRAGTDTRTAVTTAGEHEFSLHYVEDTAASPDESSYFPARRRSRLRRAEPLSAGHRRQSVDLATSLSYRDAANHGDTCCLDAVADRSINRRAKKYGHKLKQFLPDCVAGTDADAVIPDGTKCHSQDDDRSSPSPSKQRSAKTPPKSHAPCWICRSTLTGTKLPPNSMISAQSLTTTRRSSVTLIAASSQPLPTKTVTTSSISSTSAERWVNPLGRWRLLLGPSEGDRFGGDRRGVPSEELCGEASSSGGVRGDPLADRANDRDDYQKTAWQLEQFGSAKAAGYLRRWLPSIVTFAEHAVEGFEVPWTSNPVERLMGEVSKRCKNQWMRWTAEGLEAILQLRLVKYADPEYYQAFLDELLQRSTKTAINCDLSIESTCGKV